MNRNRFAGSWAQLSGRVKEHWGRLTGNQMLVVVAKRDQLAGRIQEEYAASLKQAERQLLDFAERNRHWNLTQR